jgi:uncharacterized protein (UPF0264 family)
MVRLLVSVRSSLEVGQALAGGTDIIDAKEPTRGSLGSVDPDVLDAIAARTPATIPLSAALGDVRSRSVIDREVRRLATLRPAGDLFLKLGFAGVSPEPIVGELLAAATAAASEFERPPALIAVAYADWSRAHAPSPDLVLRACAAAGFSGVLLDTSAKDGGDLFSLMTESAVGSWIRDAHDRSLLAAVAGSLDAGAIARLRDLGPDVVGVRGAACECGRLGRVAASRVRALRLAATGCHDGWGSALPAKRQTKAPIPLP